MFSSSRIAIVFSLLFSLFYGVNAAHQTEEERVAQWYARNNTWPPTWQPETNGMKRLLANREHLIMQSNGANERWENWLQFTQNRMVPKFTDVGFEKVKIPQDIYYPLYNKVAEAVRNYNAIPSEGEVDVIYNPPGRACKFLDIGPLAWETVNAMTPLHERWAGGMKLKPTSAYGIRFYQNQSSLVMHYDRVETHVISSIMHIAHEYDDQKEPWPIQIEDHNGNLHSVVLEAGEMLFYESAKCLHGRMTKLRGKYYASIFIHYQPVDPAVYNIKHADVIANVPPHWKDGVTEEAGSRWAGASLTTDDRITEDAPDRVIDGRVVSATQRSRHFDPITPPPDVLMPPVWTPSRQMAGARRSFSGEF
jgi:hypothetical protein